MKKIILIAVLAIGFLASQNFFSSPKTTVAILIPVSHPSLEQMQQGFIETLSGLTKEKIDFHIYNAQGSHSLMRGEIETILQKKPDVLLTIGSEATRMSLSIFNKKKSSIPIVFTAVASPSNLITETSYPITGVQETVPLEREARLLKKIEPAVHTILIPYDPSLYHLHEDVQRLRDLVQQQSIDVRTVEVFHPNELKAKILPSLALCDVVLVLKDNTVVRGIDSLARLCHEHKKVLMVSDLDSFQKGAHIACGVPESIYGIQAAHIVHEILTGSQATNGIPIQDVSEDQIISRIAENCPVDILGEST